MCSEKFTHISDRVRHRAAGEMRLNTETKVTPTSVTSSDNRADAESGAYPT